ncbi:hypothetical protein ACLKA6_015922 [Drosophila palustris]
MLLFGGVGWCTQEREPELTGISFQGGPNAAQTRPPGQIRRQKAEQTEISSTNRIQVFPTWSRERIQEQKMERTEILFLDRLRSTRSGRSVRSCIRLLGLVDHDAGPRIMHRVTPFRRQEMDKKYFARKTKRFCSMQRSYVVLGIT